MAPISPADTNLVPRREFIRDQRPASTFSILALSGAALLRLYSFPTDAVSELRRHLDTARLILNTRELIRDNFYELALEGKPWSNPKSMRTERLLIEIIDILHRTGHNFLSTLDYGREQDDRIIMAFSRPSPSPSPHPQPPPLPGAAFPHTFQSMSNDSLGVVSHPIKLLFAISFLSQNHLRVIAPPLHLTPAILQTVRGSWPRGVVSENKVAENVYEFKLKGYRCNVIHLLDLPTSLIGCSPTCRVPRGYLCHRFSASHPLDARYIRWLWLHALNIALAQQSITLQGPMDLHGPITIYSTRITIQQSSRVAYGASSGLHRQSS